MLWRHSRCVGTDSELSCFDCKKFDENVKNCNTRLILKNNIVTCAQKFFSVYNAFDNCSDHVKTTGECREPGVIPAQKITSESIKQSLCRKLNRKSLEHTGIKCPYISLNFSYLNKSI